MTQDHEKQFEALAAAVRTQPEIHAAHKSRLKGEMLAEFRKTSEEPFWKRNTVWFAAAAVLVAAVLISLVVWTPDNGQQIAGDEPVDVRQEKDTHYVDDEESKRPPDSAEQKEIAVTELYTNRDVAGLLAVAEKGSRKDRIAAAVFLAEIGDAAALERLKQFAESETDEMVSKAFALAVARIASRVSVDGGDLQSKKGAGSPAGGSDSSQTKWPDKDEPTVFYGPGMAVFVLDAETGEPLVDVEVKGRADKKRETLKTDSDGMCWLPFDKERPKYISLTATKEKYVPMSKSFPIKQRKMEVPVQFVFELPRGEKIGGVVQNEEGEPIANATVRLNVHVGRLDMYDVNVRLYDHDVQADEKGRWFCDQVPAEYDSFGIKLSHPEYADDVDYRWSRELPPMEEFKDLSAVLVMGRGALLEGYVYDMQSRPIANASVNQGEDRYGQEPETTTDRSGHFVFAQQEKGQVVLTVHAKGYGPQMQTTTVTDAMEPVLFYLEPGRTIRGRVVDLEGRPIAGAGVNAEEWRGKRSIRWDSKTGADGRFVWTEAPGDEVLMDVYARDRMSVRKFPMVACEQEYEIVMGPPLRISGSVTDAETGEPISKFRAIHGISWGENRSFHWEYRHGEREFKDGRYELKQNDPYYGHLVRIEAEGYLPAISDVFASDAGDVVYDFALEKGKGWSGFVFSPSGEPVEKAAVYVIAPGGYVSLSNGKSHNYKHDLRNRRAFETDSNGAFQIEPQTGIYRLVVTHETGYADFDSESSDDLERIDLVPWGRVEGKVFIRGDVAAGAKVHLYDPMAHNHPDRLNCYFGCEAVTDDEGRFVMERVRPGQCKVLRRLINADGKNVGSGAEVKVEIVSGQTSKVVLGGKGRPVAGRFVPPAGVQIPDWTLGNTRISTNIPRPSMRDIKYPRPADFDRMTVAEVLQWYQEFHQSDEGRAWLAEFNRKQGIAQAQNYGVVVDSDGTFYADEVEAGQYKLTVRICEPDGHGHYDWQKVLGTASYEFEVPPMAGDYNDEVLDLGVIQLEREGKGKLEVGDILPGLPLTAFDGNPVQLSRFRGKVLVLHQWSVHQALQPTGDIETLRQLYDRFGNHDKFVMVGVTYGGHSMAEELARKYIAEKDMEWQQCFFDASDEEAVMAFSRIKGAIVVGADGRVAEFVEDMSQLQAAVQAALDRIEQPEKVTGIE